MASDSRTFDSGNELIQIPGRWYAVDFHVHSPGSRCFEGPELVDEDQDEAYTWLLDQAHQAKLDVIAITDHNTVEGYARFLELQAELESTRRTLRRTGVPIPDRIQHQIELFDQIIILPGVELDADPNVHLLVLFDPLMPLDEVDDFLTRAGYAEDIRGTETASRYARWSVQDVCREAAKLEAIVIAAHVDSDKGLYEVSKNWGQKRIAAFTDEGLFGMEFLNPKACDQIRSILKQPDYERDTHLSFVQSSDFHGRAEDQIGERRTYVRLDEVKEAAAPVFRALRAALRNPAEYVSAPGRPEVREIQRHLDDAPCIEGLDSESDVSKLHRYVCAFSNSEDGTIVIGRNEKGNWIGVQCTDREELARQIATLVREGTNPSPRFRLELYPYYGDRVFGTIRVQIQPQICSTALDDRVYTMVRGEPTKASVDHIVHLAEDKLLERYQHLSITRRLTQMSQELGGTRDSLDILPLVRKIEAQTMPFSHFFPPPEKGEILTPDLEEAIEIQANGVVDGQVAVLLPVRPRFRDQYIRITAPMGECDLSNPVFEQASRFSGDKMLIAPQGAVYFDRGDGIVVTCRQSEPLVCQPDENYAGPPMEFVTAYLKSAVALWYAERCLGVADFSNTYQILPRMPIPRHPTGGYEKRVLDLVERLTALEHRFLEEEQSAVDVIKAKMEQEDDEALDELNREREETVNRHNEQAGELMGKLEQVFFELLNLTDEEAAVVQEGISAINLKTFE